MKSSDVWMGFIGPYYIQILEWVMNHKTDTFAQRDLTQSDTKGTDADEELCSIINSITLCNSMRLQYPGPKGMGRAVVLRSHSLLSRRQKPNCKQPGKPLG